MNKIATTNFTSELISETSMSSVVTKLGKHESSIDLYSFEEDPDYYFIEWDVPTLDMVENIGIWCEEGTKIIRDYDGVFSMPDVILEFLREQGFDVEYAE
jgi:hypothetical protein